MEAAERRSSLQKTWYRNSIFTWGAAVFIYFNEKPVEKRKIELNRGGAI